MEYDDTGAVISHGNFLTQYSFIKMERLQREAHKRYSNEVAEGDELPLNAVVAVPETWNINPYHGKFNPSTKTGQQIFEKKTKGLPRTIVSPHQKWIRRRFVAFFKHDLHL